MSGRHILSTEAFDAVLFDLDGVITATARVHAAAWKQLFDEFLAARAERDGTPFRPFGDEDYRLYVDGKPRYEGVASFLASRGLSLPLGSPEDTPDAPTVCGLGNRKNVLFNALLRRDGVEVFDSTVAVIRRLRAAGVRTAVVSSSKNCATILEVGGISGLFDLRFDGVEAARLYIKGKPAPDTYLEAARRLGVVPARAVVVEDALSGVQAGRAGGFGLVIGVDRAGNGDALLENGADIVVADLEELQV